MIIKELNITDKLKSILLKNQQFSPVSCVSGKEKCDRINQCLVNNTFTDCSQQIKKEKSSKANENQLNMKILNENSNVGSTNNNKKRFFQESQYFSNSDRNKALLNFPYAMDRLKKKKRQFRKFEISSQIDKTWRQTSKQHHHKTSDTQVLDQTSPLAIWKSTSRQYNRAKNQANMTMDQINIRKKPSVTSKQLMLLINEEKRCSAVKQQGKQYNTVKGIEVNELVKRFGTNVRSNNTIRKNNSKQNQLESNIVLRKSFSSDSSQPHKIKTRVNIRKKLNSYITERLEQTQNKKSTKVSKQNCSVVLLHNKPLQDYMQLFFSPLSLRQQKNINQIDHFVRIRTKKLTTRNIEQLQKFKKNLFKQKSKKNFLSDKSTEYTTKKQKENLLSTDSTLKQPGQESTFQNIKIPTNNKPIQKKVKGGLRPLGFREFVRRKQQMPHLVKSSLERQDLKFITSISSPRKLSVTSSSISFGQDVNVRQEINNQRESFLNAW